MNSRKASITQEALSLVVKQGCHIQGHQSLGIDKPAVVCHNRVILTFSTLNRWNIRCISDFDREGCTWPIIVKS